MAKAKSGDKVIVEGFLVRVRPPKNGRYSFLLKRSSVLRPGVASSVPSGPGDDGVSFSLVESKALVLANAQGQFPLNVLLKVSAGLAVRIRSVLG